MISLSQNACEILQFCIVLFLWVNLFCDIASQISKSFADLSVCKLNIINFVLITFISKTHFIVINLRSNSSWRSWKLSHKMTVLSAYRMVLIRSRSLSCKACLKTLSEQILNNSGDKIHPVWRFEALLFTSGIWNTDLHQVLEYVQKRSNPKPIKSYFEIN